MWKKFQFQMCVWVVARLLQRLKSTFFDIFEIAKNVCLSGCTITSKTKINVIFEIFSSLQVSFGDHPLEKKIQKPWFQTSRQTVLDCPAKMDFFPRFSSFRDFTLCGFLIMTFCVPLKKFYKKMKRSLEKYSSPYGELMAPLFYESLQLFLPESFFCISRR